jgi:2-keto-4-pentenoate hydratase/2-oxohepta-3-ene-1,7-dioic acid hydratase in catechol pathway
MRLLSFEKADGASLGVREGELVIDVSLLPGLNIGSMQQLIAGGPAALAALRTALADAPASARIALAGLRLLPPVPRPGKIACVGLNYADHRIESGLADRPAFPGMFHKMATSLVGHEQPIQRPANSVQLDFEGELAVIIGRRCHRVTAKEALDHVFGYTIMNDGSVRDFQMEKALAAGKNFDATGGCGPELVTVDELPAGGSALHLQTRLNGEVMQDSNTDRLIFDVAAIIALLSDIHTLEPGDMVSTGTCGGVGAARTPQIWLKAGDVVEIEIEGIGMLRTPVIDERTENA